MLSAVISTLFQIGFRICPCWCPGKTSRMLVNTHYQLRLLQLTKSVTRLRPVPTLCILVRSGAIKNSCRFKSLSTFISTSTYAIILSQYATVFSLWARNSSTDTPSLINTPRCHLLLLRPKLTEHSETSNHPRSVFSDLSAQVKLQEQIQGNMSYRTCKFRFAANPGLVPATEALQTMMRGHSRFTSSIPCDRYAPVQQIVFYTTCYRTQLNLGHQLEGSSGRGQLAESQLIFFLYINTRTLLQN